MSTPAGPEERGEGLECTCKNGDGTTSPRYHAKSCPIRVVAAAGLTRAYRTAFAATSATDTGAEERLRAALERLDAKQAEYDAAEQRDAALKDWKMADRWRYLGMGIGLALDEISAALGERDAGS